MKSKFELFSKNKMNSVYLTESMQTDWLQILYSYWGEVDTPYSGDFISVMSGCFNITMIFL